MKTQKNKPTLTVSVSGIKLNIIRVGNNPQLKEKPLLTTRLDEIVSAHSHFTYEVFFITHGSLEIMTGGGRTAYERKVVIIPPHISHYTSPSGNGCFCLLLSFEKDNDVSEEIKKRLSSGISELTLSDDIAYYIDALSRKSAEGTPTAEKDAWLLASLIFGEIIGMLLPTPSKKAVNTSEARHIGAIETYINQNFRKKISLSDVAKHVFLSTRQVSRIITREYGCSLSKLVTEKKLELAGMMLKSTDMKISEIAEQVNFGSQNYFYALFKKRYGTSPLQYRKQTKSSKK